MEINWNAIIKRFADESGQKDFYGELVLYTPQETLFNWLRKQPDFKEEIVKKQHQALIDRETVEKVIEILNKGDDNKTEDDDEKLRQVLLTLNYPHEIKSNIDYETAKELCTKFFYHWYNRPGANTVEGFNEWWNERCQAKSK